MSEKSKIVRKASVVKNAQCQKETQEKTDISKKEKFKLTDCFITLNFNHFWMYRKWLPRPTTLVFLFCLKKVFCLPETNWLFYSSLRAVNKLCNAVRGRVFSFLS